ncbi:MAG: hypothetical protein UV74_C0013G0240 [Candidatus Woesebacteria bacterium GW2011_GWB1_43_14]|uniref:DNA polymerase beta n=1 Tax=Candidatus Woesebacteria bacterium GW2011_GWB1_43_14 TaxID=1618578 RepID=A0A0G1GE28_9BACT|nr:MAG: hypothetical protein UT21_C0002G0054 [Candidatus Woesebacteria bacterium GW2011_GWA1_39_11b]KKS78466.1 MAG: hypothetical protein UV51_C0001G0182 [Candidatus Woesebacteria bacterium GW2011_GWC1_42_9]KKS97118.1 MAG: hypothetical protein UV74_C0013G0240 [Candidatus Woesebacteria bacterium GW2011_GWB1_43_14]
MSNREVADLLAAASAAYKIKDEQKNKFRSIAYDRASAAIEHLGSEVKDFWDDGKLEDVPGIGPNIAKHLDEIFKTGKSKHFNKVFLGVPPSVFEFLKITGVGPKKAIKLAKELNIKSSKGAIKRLSKSAKSGKIAEIERFGEGSQKVIAKSIKEHEARPKERMLISQAENIARDVVGWVSENKSVEKIEVLGSLRRRASTVGDIDIAVATKNPESILDHFIEYPNKTRTLGKGPHKASIVLPNNIQVDLMATENDSFGSLLQHFTGSKHHNIALREIAQKKGLSLSEYGIKGINNLKFKIKNFKDEESFYKSLALSWIPPELREDAGEIEAAKANKLPDLLKLSDIKADLQIHSDFDIETSHDIGDSSMVEIAKKAEKLGYQYIGFTEHNPSQRGHNERKVIELIKKKREAINRVNTKIKIFNSMEVDILPDGKLAIGDKALGELDFALVSIHSSFAQSRQSMTARVLSALSHPKVKIFAHPTARRINKREGVELDWTKIFEFCRENNRWIEINAEPTRLDLPDYLVREAVKAGVTLTLGTDSHHVRSLENMRYGVDVARRGWAERKDIINARTLVEFEKVLKGGE